jgi:NAD(P)-dependent dehydrogenase (short-subunit alcohol dehydrogenase family)
MNRKNLLLLAGLGLVSYLAYRAYQANRAPRYRGKTVLMTGGAHGLGLALARQLAAEGARLVVCSRDRDEVARAFHDLADRGATVIGLTGAPREWDKVPQLVDKVRERYGPIDLLITNAGIVREPVAEEYDEATATPPPRPAVPLFTR